jgi:hypothetical protein
METKPFFVTTEFVAALAALAALAVTAASSETLDAGLVWPLATAIVAGFVFSRGFAKAGAPSRSFDPREHWRPSNHDEEETAHMSTMTREQQYGGQAGPMYGYGRGLGMRQAIPIETKPFFLTSEFWGSIALIVGLAIAAGTSDTIDARLFWQLATAITIGYVISRGIAKSGTKSRSWDPREDLMQGARERMQSRGDDDRS